jgi:hypothetical protein
MKKNMFKVAFVAAIAMVYGINVFNSRKQEGFSNVNLANLEALASYVPAVKDCATYCTPDDRYTCYIDWGNDAELITCSNKRKK